MTGNKSLRAIAAETADALAQAGISADSGNMTPREISLALETAKRRALDLDLLAWLVGQYVAIGVNNPKKFPRKPNRIRFRKNMSDEEMKQTLISLAERRNPIDA